MSLTKCKAIVLTSVKYGDASVILKCYTDQFGLQSYIISGFKSKNAAVKPSQIQVLSLLEIEGYPPKGKGLNRMKEVKSFPVLNHLHFDLNKSSVALFIAETITRSIREENHPDHNLFHFLTNSIQILDLETKSISNFTCYFLIQFLKYIGFSPEVEDLASRKLNDLFTNVYFQQFLDSSFSNYSEIIISRAERTSFMESTLAFYSSHISDFGQLKSYPILKDLFS